MRAYSTWVLLFAAACSSPTAVTSVVDFSIVRHASSPQDPNTTQVEFVVTNTGSTTLYLPRCGENVVTGVERLEGGKWSNAGAGACQAIYRMDPIPLEPGMPVMGMRSVSGTGRFRLRTGIATDFAGTVGWHVLSGTFDIR